MKSPPKPAAIRVLLIDDSADITTILGQCIAAEADMVHVGELSSASNLARHVAAMRPDVILLDMGMPGVDPLKALAALTAGGDAPAVRTILFSGRCDDDVTDTATKAGACGFLAKHAQVPVILRAIREAARWQRGADAFMLWA